MKGLRLFGAGCHSDNPEQEGTDLIDEGITTPYWVTVNSDRNVHEGTDLIDEGITT